MCKRIRRHETNWELTPQKKCLTKITNTLRAVFGPEYRLLNEADFPSLSSTVKFSTRFRTSCEGMSFAVFTSPGNSKVGSTVEALEGEEKAVSEEVFDDVGFGV